MQFSEATGDVTLAYANLSGSARSQGSKAVIGIENTTGSVGFEYSFQQPVVSASTSITFHLPGGGPPPPSATVSGHVTLSGGGAAGSVPVTLSPSGLTTTTAADGSYSFSAVSYGSYTVSAQSGSGLCGGQSGSTPITVNGDTTGDIAMSVVQRKDTFGNTCTDGPATYIAAPTVLALTGDDAIKSITLPFPVTLYGTSYTTAWVDTNGIGRWSTLAIRMSPSPGTFRRRPYPMRRSTRSSPI